MAKNSEVYKTAQERLEAFEKFCKMECDTCKCNKMNGGICNETPYEGTFAWLDLEAEEEKPLPCLFCGGETIVRANWNSTYQVVCNSHGCWYCSKCETTKSDAIAAHNRVAKAVRESEAKA